MASNNFPVAVIGMAVKLPGVSSCEEFWQLMVSGQDNVREFPAGRAADISHVMPAFQSKLVDDKKPFFTGSFFESVDEFDPDVFQINPREALFIEPEQRMFLETVWELFEDAGYASKIKGSRTGVYVGNTVNKYKYILTENHPSVSHGNHSPFISSRISYVHNLQGPAMMVATGCSSSLLAVHLACQGLLSGDCDMAVAGGITLDLLPVSTKTDIWNQLGITGPGVKCRAFDASAKGIAKGEGCGVVLLKPLKKALSDGDHICGILEATTANQDGHSNGITAPHPGAQANMLHQAWKLADINPKDIGYFEAHGTGTELGDPIEISGITNAFRMSGVLSCDYSEEKIPIGSVKANIGHLADGAAGIVALIKTLLCMNKNSIPAAVNFSKPNPHINWQNSPVYVNTSSLDWKPHADKSPRLASVSAFGLLGTNTHAVVREHVTTDNIPGNFGRKEAESQLLALAANSRHSLVTFVAKIAAYFQTSKVRTADLLRSVCFTMNIGREQARFRYRAVTFGSTWEEMLQSLNDLSAKLEGRSLTSTVRGNTQQFAWSPNVCEIDKNVEGKITSTSFGTAVATFLSGKTVRWEEEVYAAENNSLKKIPFIPTYAFERVRLWPKVGNPINSELLRMEHQLKDQDAAGRDAEEKVQDEKTNQNNTPDVRNKGVASVDKIIEAVLNDALGTVYDWDIMTDDNFFTLGVDFLILNQVCTRLNAELVCTLSMAEIYKNPSFTGLKNQVAANLSSKSACAGIQSIVSGAIHRPSRNVDVHALLQETLNESLGKGYNWSEIGHNNLFSLGLDSLICTHVITKLKDSLGLAVPFTMAELYENPSFLGLCEVTKTKLDQQFCVPRPEDPKTTRSTAGDPDEQCFPMSFAQQRLWVMQEMATNPCVYNATNCLKITREFHPAAFLCTVNTVLARHGAFYTYFVDGKDGLSQRHDWRCETKAEEVDLRSAGEMAEQLVMRLYDEDYKTPFNLRRSPLVRCKLYYLPNDVYFFTMVIHHIIFDGWSHFVFYNQLWDNYQKLCQGKAVQKSLHLPLYVDFAREERLNAAIPESNIANDLGYWKNKLSGQLPVTTFPGDKRRPLVFTHNGERITHFIRHEMVNALEKLAGGKHTMFVTLLSAVYVLLHRYTGETDLIVGTPVAGRTNLKAKHTIGCFINTLALRVQLDGSLCFDDILTVVSKVCLDAFDHQHAPFDQIVSELNLARDTSLTPVFSVNVCYHNTEVKSDHISPPAETVVERKLLHNNSSKWDMQFDFLQEPEGLRFTLEYYSGVFSDTYAEGVVENFLSLLECITLQQSTAISELLSGQPVRHDGNNETRSALSLIHGPFSNIGDKALPALLAGSLSFHGQDSCVIAENGTKFSYGDVLINAERIAVFLRECCNIQRQSKVGLLLDNSPEALQSILASMLSGLVYVPMDPANPKPRLEHICNESEVSVIIFSKSYTSLANHLQWACPPVGVLLCVDVEQFNELEEEVRRAPLMSNELWDRVALKAANDIEGGGWQSSYTGKYMTSEEMNEYTDNVLKKLNKYLNPDTRVLEIGCASGLTTRTLCSLVGHYTATDLSQAMTDKLSVLLKGQPNVRFLCMAADQVADKLKGQMFDVIIMNSVVHCFPGHNYLRRVLSDCARLLPDGGVIFIGDIMDLDARHKLIHSLKSFKDAHPECRTKTEWQNELFLSRTFLQTVCDSSSMFESVSFTRKLHTIPKELTEFRFDALFTKSSGLKDLQDQGGFQTFAASEMSRALQAYCTSSRNDFHALVSNWAADVNFSDEAYILYTSGTTGTPRGVIIGHEALLNYSTWAAKAYKLDKHTHIPLFSPLTFDFTVTSIIPPLLKGCTVHLFKSFQDSYQAMAASTQLTTAKFSPIQLDTILSIADRPLSMSTFVLGGEELTQTLLGKLKQNKPNDNFVVWNEYGPTEATVGCVVKCFTSDDLPLKQSQLVPIGLPIDNVTVAVVRDKTKVVPVGGKGTLCIGGKCLCSDLSGDGASKLNKRGASFTSVCWGWPGGQMLLTDDIVEVMPIDGEMAYFGRQDSNTIKVNGVRVDLMEIQQAIESNYTVQSAWVCDFQHESKTHVGAAVKLKQSQGKGTSHSSWKQLLMSNLTEHLPLRCIPKVIVEVSDPPTNRNGKKDMPFLKSLFKHQIQSKEEKLDTCCRSETREVSQLQRIWQSVLPISHLPDPEEDFFLDLSGDSLQAIHLVRKMQEEGFQVSVTDVFQNPSLRKLLPVISAPRHDKAHLNHESEDFVEFRPTPIVEEYFLRKRHCPDHFSLSVVLRFLDTVEVDVLQKALRSVMMKHGSLRSRFRTDEKGVKQEVIPLPPEEPRIVEISIVGEHDHLANELGFVKLAQDLEQSHSLTEGILVSAGLIKWSNRHDDKTESDQTFVLLAVHHVVIDVVSWQQVLQDLAAAFRQLSEDESAEPVLSGFSLPFRAYCDALHAEVSGQFASEIPYWRNTESQSLEVGVLTTDDRQSSFLSARWLSKSISAGALRSTSSTLMCSDEQVLLTAFGRSMTSVHGRPKSALCLESHGRQLTSVDSTGTVGWCTTKFPFILETPLTDDLVRQVKQVGKTMSEIPNRGLGFGLLKAAGQVSMPYPKVMFVFQGSLDASTKETLDGGKFKFDQIPWIEIMLNELKHGRFHRHPNEILEFDLEIIAWIHGGELKFGCLFDRETISESLVEDLLKRTELNLKVLARKASKTAPEISIEVIAGFTITPGCLNTIQEALSYHDITAKRINVVPHEQTLQSLYQGSEYSVDITVLIPRNTDDEKAIEFMDAHRHCKERQTSEVLIVNADTIPNSAKLDLEALQTENLTLLPEFVGKECYDTESDFQFGMPLTQSGYTHLGLTTARAIRAAVCKPGYKVVAVDADYTLWTGESAQGAVEFSKGNLILQEFLLCQRKKGMLLVMLSKNSEDDVDRVFNTQSVQMILTKEDFVAIIANWEQKTDNIKLVAKQLNLGLDKFVFIDDNPLECEQMLLSCPEVLTVQTPHEDHLVAPLLESMWALDVGHISNEASERTKMYRDEFARQREIETLESVDVSFREAKIFELLADWDMRMIICKTTAGSLRRNKTLWTRAEELLYRTNQFKLNDVNTRLGKVQEDDICWLVALKDCHGAYGIISVCLLSSSRSVLNQWVVSCRVLGREVEQRIMYELYVDALKAGNKNTLQLVVSKTDHNTPMVTFLMSLGATVSERRMEFVSIQDVYLEQTKADLHKVVCTSDLEFFEVNARIEVERKHHQKHAEQTEKIPTGVHHAQYGLLNVNTWIEETWSQAQKGQSAYHHLFPIIPACEDLGTPNQKYGSILDSGGREEKLQAAWMDVLQSNQVPEDTQSFLASGGSSFSAVFLVSKLRRTCGINISIMDILQNPVYSDFREVVMQAGSIIDEAPMCLQISEGRYGLSAAQQRMVIMQQAAPESTAYVETVVGLTLNDIKPSEIFKTLTQLHPILTSTIEIDDEKGFVVTLSDKVVYITEIERVRNNDMVEDYLKNSTPVMDILNSPLVKFRHCVAEQTTILIVHVHHVIVDEITLKNIARDLHSLMEGKGSMVTRGLDYPSYVDWERAYFQSAQHEDDKQFWVKTFSDIPPNASLAILPSSEPVWSDTDLYTAKHDRNLISAETVKEINKYCHYIGVTTFQYYLACTVLVLHRYIGTDDITLAVPVTTRSDIHQNTDGLFVNTVLFREVAGKEITFTDYVKDMANSWMKTLCHANCPIDEIVRMVREKHGQSVTSFCNVMFNYTTLNSPGNLMHVPSKHAKMPVSLDVVYNETEMTVELRTEWADGLIDDGIAVRLANSVASMYDKAVREAGNIIKRIETLSTSELDLLQSLNRNPDGPHQLNHEVPVQKKFEDHAARYPDSTAVICGDSTTGMSYKDLNAMAASIACGLTEKTDQASLKDRPVVIVMQKDEYAVASIFGIWKAGGHFLPVAANNQNPLKDVVERCDPAALLYNIPFEALSLPTSIKKSCPVLSIRDLIEKPSKGEFETSNTKNISADTLAYIITTSGSTGVPKHCKVSHKSLGVIATAWEKAYKMTDMAVNVLQWAPISFDVFTGDVVRGLICAHGRLTICPDEFRLDIPYILALMKQHSITMAEVTPQFGSQLVENALPNQLESIKLLILGSDVLQEHIYKKVKRFLEPNQRVINSYGMTEATIDSSYFEGPSVPKTRSGTVPIGKPLSGVGFHVLDTSTLQPCPVGTVGELYITGDILASGDSESVQLGHLQCVGLKTGDAACWLPTGDVDLLGRLDNMVKLRGFRISTTEIENKILRLVTGVKGACVVPLTKDVESHDAESDDAEFLCAFLVLEEGARKLEINRQYVRQKLQAELAYYMLPDVVTVIDEVPLTAHGKVHYKALPDLSDILEMNVVKEMTHDTSESETASILKKLFAEAMGIREISQIPCDRTFMELGAHSLILVRFSSLMKQKSEFDVRIADLFSYPSLSSLADYIDRSVKNTPGTGSLEKDCGQNERDEEIAITGLGLRLPGGIMSLPQLWEVLAKGEDLIRDFPTSRAKDVLECMDFTVKDNTDKLETFNGAFLEQIDHFDHRFFKIAPGEAKHMSPEQRLFLQVATEALAEGNHLPTLRGSKIGVFVGNTEVGYSKLDHPDEPICISGLLPGMIATRVAYQWDLQGPTMLIDTACSSSLVALKQACDSIRRNECEAALVGGVNLVLYPARTGVFGQASILSPDYHCRAFDKDASGTAAGEGVLCLYVEPLRKALPGKKTIYGVVKAAAINSVGHGNGITAPTPSSQKLVIQDALKAAQVQPSDISFIESHGTGTNLGDKIEISALSSIFNKDNQVEDCPVGSIKSTFGHLDSAAGILGVFKILASFMYKQIAPNANFKTPNPELAGTSLYVPAETKSWVVGDSVAKTAGVSSFGLTGTNCHVVLAESSATHKEEKGGDLKSHPLLLSGSCLEHIKKQLSVYRTFIEQSCGKSNFHLSSLCVTVANRLKELADANLGHGDWRMLITAGNPTKMLNLMDIIMAAEDTDAVVEIAALRSDVFLHCPVQNRNKAAHSVIRDFLTTGKIDTSSLFAGNGDLTPPAAGVTLAMYSESRHWLEPTSRKVTTGREEGLLDLLQKKLSETREMVRSLPLSPTKDLADLEGTFCSAIIVRFLMRTSLEHHLMGSKEISFQEAFILSGMHTRYKGLFFVMIRELWLKDLVHATGFDRSIHCLDSFKLGCEKFLNTDPETITSCAVEKYPAWADCFRFPLYCSKHYDKVLCGNMSPLSVIYPQGDLNFMYQFDKLGDLLGDVYYNMYMQVIAEYAKQLSKRGKEVRVLEVGAGVGHVTRQLLPKLKNTPGIEYWFTDLGKAFVEHAKVLFSEYLYMMKLCTFDITKSAPKQGLLGSFDIIISYNVIHTTQSVMDSVVNLKSCLGDEGKLFIIESARNDTWATLAWGILDGWWYFKDYDLRPAEPMLEPEKWEKVLEDAGFGSVHSCPVDETERSHVEKFLFVCSGSPLSASNIEELPKLGWWECDAHKFDPLKTYDKLETHGVNADDEIEEVVDRDKIQMELQRIWSELLGIDTIQADDDFASLGGESLLAIQMIKLVRKRLGYQLEIADTFGYPTLRSLANFIADRMVEKSVHLKTDSGFPHPAKRLEASKSDGISDEKAKQSLPCATSVAGSATKNQGIFSVFSHQDTLLMFPGQGAQKPGMCISMKDSPEAQIVFKKAETIIGYNILDICLRNDTELQERLTSTEFVQVALLVGCLAKLEQLKVERPELIGNTTSVAGLSVGEFVALVYAGVVNFEDALHLVQQRGRAMEAQVRDSPTGMVSVLGPTCEQLEDFLLQHFPDMEISTYLAENQFTVAGTEGDCQALMETLSIQTEDQMQVIDVRKLRVAGAFHSKFMKKAADVIDPIIEGMTFSKPTIPIIMNASGTTTSDPLEIKSLIRQQLVSAVKWKQSVVTAFDLGVRYFVEVAPGRVLSSIVKNRISRCKDCSTEFIIM